MLRYATDDHLVIDFLLRADAMLDFSAQKCQRFYADRVLRYAT